MNNNFGINNDIYTSILNIFEKDNDIIEVKIFGSRARGDYNKSSDIDLAIKFSKDGNKLKIIDKLEDIRCILKFDVIDIDKISNELLLNNINRDGIVIYKKDGD